jgi:hypothetical protein
MTSATTIPDLDTPTSGRAADKSARRTRFAAYVALGWVVLFFAFHVYWYLGGTLASPGELPPLRPHSDADGSARARVQLVAMIVSVPVDSAWPIGAFVCLAIARGWLRERLARAAQTLVWVGCVVLLLRGGSGLVDDGTRATGLLSNGITGLSLKATTGHAHLRWADWTIDSYFLAGGIIFLLLAIHHRAQQAHSRPRSAGDPAGPRPVGNELAELAPSTQTEDLSEATPAIGSAAPQPVPAWADRLAHAIPLMALPSGLWRLAVAFGFSMGSFNDAGEPLDVHGWASVYIVAITLLSEAVALTAFGLVRPWGEVAPAWLPIIGGRPVRPRAAIIPATLGSVALMLIWTLGFWEVWTGEQAHEMASSFWAVVFAGCYAPLNLWGPALLALTWAYHRRRAGSALDQGWA